MDDIVSDPTFGPELVTFLSQKVTTTKEALNASLAENELLRDEIRKLKEERPPDALVPKQEIFEGQILVGMTCRIGQCKSLDEIELLRIQIADLSSRLEATEQALQDSATSLVEVEGKYEKARMRSKERKETINELRKQLRDMKEAEQSGTSAIAKASQNDGDTHDVFKDAIIISPDQPHIPRQWITQPCISFHISMKDWPQPLRSIARSRDILYNPELCVVDSDGGTALLYECHARYRTGEEDEGRRWVVRSDIVELTGERREVLYWKDNAVCYAGTFEADTDLYIHETEDYRQLTPKIRRSLLQSCVLTGGGYPPITASERDRIASQHWSGIARIQSLRWQRVGFNVPLYMALLNLRAQPKSTGASSSKKRKYPQQNAYNSQKKSKSQ